MNHKDFNAFQENLPRCPGIMGREKYFNSAVLIPFVMIAGEYHLLFQRRAPQIRQGTEICFPGGAYDGERGGSGSVSSSIRQPSLGLSTPK